MCVSVLERTLLLLAMLIEDVLVSPSMHQCDTQLNIALEGSQGISPFFAWIGVLRPTLKTNRPRKGTVILVKDGFALGVADEISRLSRFMIKGHAHVTFISDTPHSYKVVDWLPHPEYDEDALDGFTVNAVALLQLQPLNPADILAPIKPVCLQDDLNAHKLSQHIYAILLDYKQLKMEKEFYSMQYMETKSCQEFYINGGLTEQGFEPIALQCAHATNLQSSCVWEAGVALVSNATGPWVLLGVGTKSLGCANPTRFIDVAPYVPWIEAITSSDRWRTAQTRRFATSGKGFRRQKKYPVRQGKEVHLTDPEVDTLLQGKYPFSIDAIGGSFNLHRYNDTEISFVPVPGHWGDCNDKNNRLVFSEHTRIIASGENGNVQYKLTLFDERFQKLTCIKISLTANGADDAAIFVDYEIQNREGMSFNKFGDTPSEILVPVKVPSLYKVPSTTTDRNNKNEWVTGPPKRLYFLEEDKPILTNINHNVFLKNEWVTDRRVCGGSKRLCFLEKDKPILRKINHNVFLKLYFSDEAMLNVLVFGPAEVIVRPTSSTTPPPFRRRIDHVTRTTPRISRTQAALMPETRTMRSRVRSKGPGRQRTYVPDKLGQQIAQAVSSSERLGTRNLAKPLPMEGLIICLIVLYIF